MNGKRIHAGANWETPDRLQLAHSKVGINEIVIVAKNEGSGPNPAGLFFEARWLGKGGAAGTLVSDASWQWSKQLPNETGIYEQQPEDWQPAAKVSGEAVWMSRVQGELAAHLARQGDAALPMVRAALVKSNFLMRSLGRPNRDQIVSVRPLELTTLEAIDLSNGEALAGLLRQGGAKLAARQWASPDAFIDWLFRYALCREPTAAERLTLHEVIGDKLTPAAIEDVLWSVVMLPEFQIVR
jgi:hypothetical protein